MALALNTSHPLHASLKLLIGIDDDNSLVDLVDPTRTFTLGSGSSFGSGTFGRHFRTAGSGTSPAGATLSPAFVPASLGLSSETGTLLVVVNATHSASASDYAHYIGPGVTASDQQKMPHLVAGGIAADLKVRGRAQNTSTGQKQVTSPSVTSYGGAQMWTLTKTGITDHALYCNGTQEVLGARLGSLNDTEPQLAFIGGTPAAASVDFELVWAAWFDVVLTPTQVSDLYASLGADNAFAMVEGGAATPVTFSGSVSNQTGTEGTAFSLDLSTYFSGTETPFAYSVQAGTLPAGLSLNSSTGVISGTPTTAGVSSGIVIRATDATPGTADTNSFSITINAAGDASPPTLTGTVTFTSITQTSYTANWPAGLDNVGVNGYEYQIGSTAGAWTDVGNNLSAAITGRTAGTTETVYVRAYDAAGLRSTPPISGSVTLESALPAGINVTEPLKNNTGTLLANLSGVGVAVLSASDFTYGLTTNASGILSTISGAGITAGQQYHIAIKLADGGVGITGPITAS